MQYKVALYFSHRVSQAAEKKACWLRLDAEAANVAPSCLASVGAVQAASFFLTGHRGKEIGRIVLSHCFRGESGLHVDILQFFLMYKDDRQCLFSDAFLKWEIYLCRLEGRDVCCTPQGQLKFS